MVDFRIFFGDIDEDNDLNMLSTTDVHVCDGFKHDLGEIDNCNDNISVCRAEYFSDKEFENL